MKRSSICSGHERGGGPGGGGSRPGRARRGSEPGPPRPPPPPSPAISHLTPEEIHILQDVFKKQEDFEKSHDSYARSLERELRTLEERVRQQAVQKSKLKQYDLRLCRLCFKTKFADCIGRVCYDCHRRVCNKCGSFILARNKQSNKGRWRCYLCRKRREYACLTGVWFHGNEGRPSIDSSDFRRKLSDIINWVETDWEHSDVNFSGSELADLRPSARDAKTDSELATLGERALTVQDAASPRSCRRLVRRRTTSSGTDHEPEEEEEHFVDADQFMLERRKCRRERLEHQRRANRRRGSRRGSAPFIGLDDSGSNLDLSPDGRSQTSSMSEQSGQQHRPGRGHVTDPTIRARRNQPAVGPHPKAGGPPPPPPPAAAAAAAASYRDRHERDRLEWDRSERDRMERDRTERDRIERDRSDRVERDRTERERVEWERCERERIEREWDRCEREERASRDHQRRPSGTQHQGAPPDVMTSSRERHSRSDCRRPARGVQRSHSASATPGVGGTGNDRSPSVGRRQSRSGTAPPTPAPERERKYSVQHGGSTGAGKVPSEPRKLSQASGTSGKSSGGSGEKKQRARRPSADASCQISEGDAPLAVLQRVGQMSFVGGEPKLLVACKKHSMGGSGSGHGMGGSGSGHGMGGSGSGSGSGHGMGGSGSGHGMGGSGNGHGIGGSGSGHTDQRRSSDMTYMTSRDGPRPRSPDCKTHGGGAISRDKSSSPGTSPYRKHSDHTDDMSPRRRLPRQQSMTVYGSGPYDEDGGRERGAQRRTGTGSARPPLTSQSSLSLPRRPYSPPSGSGSVIVDWEARRKLNTGNESVANYEPGPSSPGKAIARDRSNGGGGGGGGGDERERRASEHVLERRVSGQSFQGWLSGGSRDDLVSGEERVGRNASPSRRTSPRRRYSAGNIRAPWMTSNGSPRPSFQRQASSGPFIVLLHRDPKDTSCRMSGLGMRIMGGKMTPDGTLATFVTSVVKGGSADQNNIRPGDQLLEWDGQNLEDATFEEVRQVMDRSGDTVQLVVLHTAMEFNGEKSGGGNESKNIPQWHPNSETRRSLRAPVSRAQKRLLPKTPEDHQRPLCANEVEVKRERQSVATQRLGVMGRLNLQLRHSTREARLLMRLIQCEGLTPRANSEPPHPYVKVFLLPDRSRFPMMRTLPKSGTTDPQWNAKFAFENIAANELKTLAIEVTVWDAVPDAHAPPDFLGEVLLDLTNACLDGTDVWYPLEDHDENSGPLPVGRPSPEEIEADSARRTTWRSLPSLPRTPAYDRAKKLLDKRPPADSRHLDSLLMPPELSESSPQLYKRRISPVNMQINSQEGGEKTKHISSSTSNPEDLGQRNANPNSRCRPTLKVRLMRQMSDAVNKVSARLADKRSHSLDSSGDNLKVSTLGVPEEDTERRHSTSGVTSNNSRHDSKHSCSTPPINLELLTAPVSRSSSHSSGSRYQSTCEDTDFDGICFSPLPTMTVGSEDHITPPSMGPAQVTPRRSFYDDVKGPAPASILLGLIITKGQMEVDVVKTRGLTSKSKTAPDTYVKLCLLDGTRRLQQKKTKVVKESKDPIYHQQIKYAACNIHGRHLQVQVKEKSGRFEKSVCLGEAVVRLDSLDLSHKTTGWYRLFERGEVEVGSSESLHVFSPQQYDREIIEQSSVFKMTH